MGRIGSMISEAAAMSTAYAERLLAGVRPEQFARLARPGGAVLQSNHAAFVYGHLTLYPRRVVELLGAPAGATAYPAEWEPLFKNGAECRDDADGRLYPPMKDVTERCFAAYAAAREALAAAADEKLLAANPSEGRMRELFPTLGGMLNFYLVGHVQMHLGQVSAWRRAMGLPAA